MQQITRQISVGLLVALAGLLGLVHPVAWAKVMPINLQMPAQATLTDTVVVPGERVGAVTRRTTRSDLATLFGEAQLSDDEIALSEGETELGTVVTLDADRSFTVIWSSPARDEAIAVVNLGSAWKTPECIGVGMTLTDLETALGEFEFYGFDWDYGGYVVLEGSKLSNYVGKLVLQVAPSDEAREQSPEALDALVGEEVFSSTDANARSLDISVDSMSVLL